MLASGRRRIMLGALCSVLAVCGWSAMPAAAAQVVEVEAILVQASNQPGPGDRRLAGVENQLRQVFQFQRYEVLGVRRQTMRVTQQVRLDMGHGYAVNIHSSPGNGRIRAQIEWFHGGTRLLNTSINQAPGVPAILGGPPYGGGTLILVLQFR